MTVPNPLLRPDPELPAGAAAPFGDIGAATDRDPATGRWQPGNTAALVVGQFSTAFWAEHTAARQEIRQAIISDAGHTEADAPRALSIAAESIAQATLVRDAAYLHLVESGGPLAASGRPRRALTVWASAVDRLERHLRLVGLRRVPRSTMDPARAYMREAER